MGILIADPDFLEDLEAIRTANPTAFAELKARVTATATELRQKQAAALNVNTMSAADVARRAAGLGITSSQLKMCGRMGIDPVAFSRQQRQQRRAAP